jgi:hypothetical protein
MILINQVSFKAILKLEVSPVNDALQLHYSLHQFNGALTESIIQSIEANPTSPGLFKALPLEVVFRQDLSLAQSERIHLVFRQQLESGFQSGVTIPIDFYGLKLFLPTQDLYALSNFIYQFITTYEMIRLNIRILQEKEERPIEPSEQVNPNNQMVNPTANQEIIDETATIELSETDNTVLLTETLRLSPNRVTSYIISKHIANIVNSKRYEKITITEMEGKAVITVSPLIDQQLIEICSSHYNSILTIINSFDYSQEEYISKLKLIVRQLVYITTNFETLKQYSELVLTIKVLEFLLFIYSIKLSPSSFTSNISLDNLYTSSLFNQSMMYIVNYSINFTIINYMDRTKMKYYEISFDHPITVEYHDEELSLEEIKHILTNKLYLIDIDKDHFINEVFADVSKKTETNDHRVKLILNSPKILSIKQYLNHDEMTGSWCSYNIIQSDQKQFESNMIITPEYLQVLKLSNIPVSSYSLVNNLHPIVALYADTIINTIFKELSTLDTTQSVSTLHLINHYIRPYLNGDSRIDTELILLYRIIIPFLYDSYHIDSFVDYFH